MATVLYGVLLEATVAAHLPSVPSVPDPLNLRAWPERKNSCSTKLASPKNSARAPKPGVAGPGVTVAVGTAAWADQAIQARAAASAPRRNTALRGVFMVFSLERR